MTDERLDPPIVIRRFSDGEHEEIRRLAQLDSRRAPGGEFLGAKVDGRLVAAVSLETGETIADPFSETEGIRRILELRRRQLNARRRYRRPAGRFTGRAPAFRG